MQVYYDKISFLVDYSIDYSVFFGGIFDIFLFFLKFLKFVQCYGMFFVIGCFLSGLVN